MNRIVIAAVVVMTALILTSVASAHQGHLHKALGTIASVQGEQIEIATRDGKSLIVKIDRKTSVTRKNDKLDATALKVGERVSVEYMEENKIMMARTIKLATTTAVKNTATVSEK
jgi:hypothetical protein